MASNKIAFLPTVALTATTTVNLFSPGTITGGTNIPEGTNLYYIIKHIRVGNTTNAPIRFALWKAATGANTAGKEYIFVGTATAGTLDANVGTSVAANSFVECYPGTRLDAADATNKFIVGGASAVGLTMNIEVEYGVS